MKKILFILLILSASARADTNEFTGLFFGEDGQRVAKTVLADTNRCQLAKALNVSATHERLVLRGNHALAGVRETQLDFHRQQLASMKISFVADTETAARIFANLKNQMTSRLGAPDHESEIRVTWHTKNIAAELEAGVLMPGVTLSIEESRRAAAMARDDAAETGKQIGHL